MVQSTKSSIPGPRYGYRFVDMQPCNHETDSSCVRCEAYVRWMAPAIQWELSLPQNEQGITHRPCWQHKRGEFTNGCSRCLGWGEFEKRATKRFNEFQKTGVVREPIFIAKAKTSKKSPFSLPAPLKVRTKASRPILMLPSVVDITASSSEDNTVRVVPESIVREIDGGTRSTVERGYVYIVTHPLFEGWVKIGSTFDLKKRLAMYQTGDPLRRYRLEHHCLVQDRKLIEKKLHALFGNLCDHNGNEWFSAHLLDAIRIFDNLISDAKAVDAGTKKPYG